jgi:hypothetical protein
MNKRDPKKEERLYKPILSWLKDFLKNKNPRAKIYVSDVHSVNLSDFLEKTEFKKFFPEYSAYKIKIDLIGIVKTSDKCLLIFIEVKDAQLNLMHLSQLLGYCKIVRPMYAFLISPKGISKPLNNLLVHFKRLDILEYIPNRFIRIAKWDSSRNAIRTDSIIPPL